MKHCPDCNAILPDTSDQCNVCWEKLEPECYGQAMEQKPVRIPVKLILIFLLAAAAGFYWWKSYSLLSKAPEQSSGVHVQLKDIAFSVQ